MAFGEREFPFQKGQKTALHLASVYCEGEGIAAVFSHVVFNFQLQMQRVLCPIHLLHDRPSPSQIHRVMWIFWLPSISIYPYSSCKQPRNTQAWQVLVNCISSICASASQQKRLFCLSLQVHRSVWIPTAITKSLLNVMTLCLLNLFEQLINQPKIKFKKEVSMFIIKGTVLIVYLNFVSLGIGGVWGRYYTNSGNGFILCLGFVWVWVFFNLFCFVYLFVFSQGENVIWRQDNRSSFVSGSLVIWNNWTEINRVAQLFL